MTPDSDDGLAALVRRSHSGDDRALAELRERLHDLVRWVELEEIERQAREAWVQTGEPVRRAARLRALDKAAARLARPGAGPLERLLAGRAALAEARLADVRNLANRVDRKAPPSVVRDLARRVKRAERDAAAADRSLRAFQRRLMPGP